MDIRVDRHPGPPPSENEIIARMREEGKERLGRSQVGGLPRTDPHRINVTPARKARQPCPQGAFDPNADGREYRVQCRGELGVPVPDRELQAVGLTFQGLPAGYGPAGSPTRRGGDR